MNEQTNNMPDNEDIASLTELIFTTYDLDHFIEHFETIFHQTSLWAIRFSIDDEVAVYAKMYDSMYLLNLFIESLKAEITGLALTSKQIKRFMF